MVTVTRWLRWNGVYDLAGICNRPLTPLDSAAEQILAIKERLYLLGFNCGILDNVMNGAMNDAALTFNGYFNHPTFRKWIRPAKVSDPPPHILLPLTLSFDTDTIECFKQIEDELPPPAAPVAAARSSRDVDVSRSRRERSDFGVTLNMAVPLAVKIVSVPESIAPFSDFAAIKVEVAGFEHVKSMMIRIYRNFDSRTDTNAIPGERMVYQEILDDKAIAALTDKDFKGNIGKHHKAKAYIMRQVIGGGMNGSFGNYIGVSYDRLHAPYKIRVWVSAKDKFFDKYAYQATANAPSRKISKSDEPHLHYLDDDKRTEVQRRRKVSLRDTGEVQDVFHLIEPDINHVDTVHDKSNIVRSDASDPIRLYWNDLSNSNAALKRSKFWTKKDGDEINLIGKTCPQHNTRFLVDNLIEEEIFPKLFAGDPVEIYWDLRTRLDNEGENFRYPELKEVFANVSRHMNIIKRRLCCGQWSGIDAAVRSDALSFIEKIASTPDELKAAGFPYEKCLIFLNSFVSFVSYVVHKAVVQAELDFYINFDLQANIQPPFNGSNDSFKNYAVYLRDRRNNIDGCRSTAESEYGMQAGHNFHAATKAEPFFAVLGIKDSYLKIKEGVDGWMDYKTRKIAKVILVPSYNPLDAYFFVRIRAVPMFMIGMLDMQYLNADGIRQIPVGFFEHDCFHVTTPNTGTQQWRTLYKRLCEVIDASVAPKLTEKAVYDRWQVNIKTIHQMLNAYTDNKKKTLGFLLFWLLHEPRSGSVYKYLQEQGVAPSNIADMMNSFPHPAVPEPTSISNRLKYGHKMALQNIRQEDDTDFFGDYSHPFMTDLDAAAKIIKQFILPRMNDLP